MTADSITSEIEAHARRLVEVLGGKWMRTHGMCRCPAHADRTPSLSISVGRQAVLLHCFAGCATVTVIAALARQGVKMADLFGSEVEPWPSPATEPRKAAPDRNAVRLWKQAHGIAGSAAAAYLAGRSIETCSPELRFHPRTPLGPRGAVRFLPAMLAAVRTDLGVIAIHRTFLTPDGSGKAAVEGARRALGNLGTGAVRLGWPFEGIARRSWRSDDGGTAAVPSVRGLRRLCWRCPTSDGAWTSCTIRWRRGAGSECSTSSTM